MLAAILTPPQASASASAPVVVGQPRLTDSSWTPYLEVPVTAADGVKSITARLMAGSDVEATIDRFDLVSGDAKGGVWRSAEALPLRVYYMSVQAKVTSVTGEVASAGLHIDRRATPRFAEVGIEERPADGSDRTVGYRGRLVYTERDGSEASAVGTVELHVADVRFAAISLDGEGRFVGSRTLRSGGPATVVFQENMMLRSATSPVTQISGTPLLNTQITDTVIAPDPVGKGAIFTVTGRLVHAFTTPLSGSPVSLNSVDRDLTRSTEVAKVTTDAEGRFRFSVKAVEDGYWAVRYAGDMSEGAAVWYSGSGTGALGPLDVKYRTAIASFNAGPEPVVKGKTLTMTGVLKRSVDGSTWEVWGGRTAYLYYQLPGSAAWNYAGSAKTNASGKFTRSFKASKDATWRATFKGDADTLPVNSATDYIDVR